MSLETGTWTNARGEALHTLKCTPLSGSTKAVLIWHHGYGEHCGRYQYVMEKLAEKGIAMYSYDMFPFGRSHPDVKTRGKIPNWQFLVDDIIAYTAHVTSDIGADVPVFVGGQSLGGFISAEAAQQQPSKYKGVMMSSAAVGVELTTLMKIQNALSPIFLTLSPWARLVDAVRLEDLCPDQAVIDEYVADPCNYPGKLRVKTANNILKAQQSFEKRWGDIHMPIYAHHGAVDKCTSLAAMRRFLDAVASDDITLHVVENGYHELLKGPEKDDVIQYMVDWIEEHIKA